MLTVFLGGARAGKSTLAERWAAEHGPAVVIATGVGSDVEMAERIERHRDDRPSTWTTVEEPTELASAIDTAPEADTIIIECLTTWLGNLMYRGDQSGDIEFANASAIEASTRRSSHIIVVTNEVGLGIVPNTELGRSYRDQLGRINQQWVAAADEAYLIIAGRALKLHDLAGRS